MGLCACRIRREFLQEEAELSDDEYVGTKAGAGLRAELSGLEQLAALDDASELHELRRMVNEELRGSSLL